MIGKTLAHYEITGLLGKGGMGEVYQARDTKLERQVALKVLPADLAKDPGRLKRLQREAKALAALDHPNIVSVYSIEQADSVHFLTMAHVEGQTLEKLIPDEGLGPERVLELAVPLVDALRAAHAQGIVHRDLKPANIMVDVEGRLRVLDFGIAKHLPESGAPDTSHLPTRTMTALGTVLGTYPYMSPEQAEGKAADARADIFSVGVVLYEMVSGRRPFAGDNAAALVSSILKDKPAPLGEIAPSAPEALERIVHRCLEKAPENRYQTVQDVREDLEYLERGLAASRGSIAKARSDVAVPAMWRRLAVGGLLTVVVVLGAITLGRDSGTSPPGAETPRISSLAVLPLQNRTGDPEQGYFVDGMTEALIADLSKIGSLKVTSRSAAMRYKGSDKPMPEIARELDVEGFVEGQVLREGDRVGIRVQLIEAATERNLWGETYNQRMTSILELQSEVAQAIARQIQVALTPEEQTLLAAERPVDPEAYEAYLRGVSHWNELTPADLDTALQYFRLALQEDPEFAPAHAGISMVWLGRQQMGLAPPGVARPAARAAATRALELDETLADGHSTLAILSAWGDWNWRVAEVEFDRALELRPNDPRALAYYSHVLLFLGRSGEALARADRALELDPFNPLYKALYGHVLGLSGRQDEALEQFRDALRTVPNHPVALFGLWINLHAKGSLDEALVAAKASLIATAEVELAQALDRGYIEGDYETAMRSASAVLADRPPERFFPALNASTIHLQAGDIDGALDWMESGLEIRDPSLPYCSVGPYLAALRLEPRYQEVLRRMNLPLL